MYYKLMAHFDPNQGRIQKGCIARVVKVALFAFLKAESYVNTAARIVRVGTIVE